MGPVSIMYINESVETITDNDFARHLVPSWSDLVSS